MDVIQFVDGVSATPTVRLNLNNESPWACTAVDFSPPRLKAAWASTLLVDGERLTASAYANRTLTLSLELIGTQDASATALQALWRELDRPANFIRYQPVGATEPIFFQTLRSADNTVRDWPGSGANVLRTVEVKVEAKPHAVGLRESPAAVTVSNNPAAGANGMYLDVSGVKGDVDTPLFLEVASTVIGSGRRKSAIGVRRRGTPSAMPLVLQAEAMTAFSDTSVQPNSAVMSGSGSNYMRTSFATDQSLAPRLFSSVFPAAASVDTRGTYRVFARVRKTVSGDTITMRLMAGLDGATVVGDTVTLPAGTDLRWVDLGLLAFPLGYDPVTDGYSGAGVPVRGIELIIAAGRTGTGSLDTDCLLLVPADDRFCEVLWPEYAGPTAFVIDSAANQVYALTSGELRSTQFTEMDGLPPMLSPGVTNRVVFMLDVGNTATGGDALSATTQITPYYWPRYLHIRPVAS